MSILHTTKELDSELKLFLQNNTRVNINDRQIIAREELLPRKFPIIAIRLEGWSETELNIAEKRIDYNFELVIVERLSRNARGAYERNMDLVDCVILALEDDMSIDGTFREGIITEADISPVIVEDTNESSTIPFIRTFLTYDAWRNSPAGQPN